LIIDYLVLWDLGMSQHLIWASRSARDQSAVVQVSYYLLVRFYLSTWAEFTEFRLYILSPFACFFSSFRFFTASWQK